jgi:hypothetical protein
LAPVQPVLSKGILTDGPQDISFVGQENVGKVKCDHIRLARTNYDLDVWAETGEKPFIRKTVFLLRGKSGRGRLEAPLLIAVFDKWNLPSSSADPEGVK